MPAPSPAAMAAHLQPNSPVKHESFPLDHISRRDKARDVGCGSSFSKNPVGQATIGLPHQRLQFIGSAYLFR
jgi:hypothetical protein